MKNKKIKIISKDYKTDEKIIKEVDLKSVHEINGVEIAIIKDDCRYYPFAPYHKASGQRIGQPQKLLKEVLPHVKERIMRVFSQPERWENFLLLVSQQEIIN